MAVVAAGALVTTQMSGGEQDSPSAQPDTTVSSTVPGTTDRSTDDGDVSRSANRESLPESSTGTTDTAKHDAGAGDATIAPPEPAGTKFATTELNIRTGPGEQYDVLTTVAAGDKLTVTDTTEGPWAEVIYDDEARWVTAEYLSEKKPEEDTGGITDEPCASGSEVESGLTPDAILVHRTVCAEFPEVTTYGGLRPGDPGEHGTGQALDIMITGATGDEIAAFVQSNASDLGVSEVIWEQQIWTLERAAEGWRPMEDLGSITANHYDHVHVTVYGDSAG
ncbi:MAG: SH3 domain-containing protein [Nocardioidaceae bacterium]